MLRAFDLTLRQLQYAVAVADSGRFRLAAEACHVSQPALSTQLAQLERALGARLFERDRRRVLVTPAGEALLARARAVLAAAADLVESAQRLGDPLSGRLRIGVIPTVAPYVLPEVAPALRRAFPRLELLWREDRTARVVEDLAVGALDAGLLALEAELGDLEQAPVARDPFLLAAPSGHPLTRRARVRLPDLDGARVLLLEDGHCLRAQALALCARTRVEEADFRATSLATLTQMVVGGAGVTLLPSLAARVENRSGALALRPFEAPAPGRTLALVWRRGAPQAEALRAIARVVKEAWPRPDATRGRAVGGRPRAAPPRAAKPRGRGGPPARRRPRAARRSGARRRSRRAAARSRAGR